MGKRLDRDDEQGLAVALVAVSFLLVFLVFWDIF